MEVCVDSVISARNAEEGGAVRLELCGNLMEGGTTPSCGLLRVIKQTVSLPVFVMIRPRAGDFLYTTDEFHVMTEDVKSLKATGADGFVFGVLQADGTVDQTRCRTLMENCRPLPVTFHRAIDMTKDITESVESIIDLGFERILTSGGEPDVNSGLNVIKAMVEKAQGRIVIIPGGGITTKNLGEILEITGAREFHGTGRTTVRSKMTFRKSNVKMGSNMSEDAEYVWKVTSVDTVREMMGIWATYNKEGS